MTRMIRKLLIIYELKQYMCHGLQKEHPAHRKVKTTTHVPATFSVPKDTSALTSVLSFGSWLVVSLRSLTDCVNISMMNMVFACTDYYLSYSVYHLKKSITTGIRNILNV